MSALPQEDEEVPGPAISPAGDLQSLLGTRETWTKSPSALIQTFHDLLFLLNAVIRNRLSEYRSGPDHRNTGSGGTNLIWPPHRHAQVELND